MKIVNVHTEFVSKSNNCLDFYPGVCFGLASSFGVVISSVATYRWSMTLVRQMALALVAMTVCVVILFILFAFGCEDAEQLIGVRSDER